MTAMEKKKTIAVVGLGLIGGSIALALQGFEDYEVLGIAYNEEIETYAKANHVADRVTQDETAVRTADVTWLCMPPQAIIDFLQRHKTDFKSGSLVTDVCGVKTAIVDAARVLPDDVDFIGCHPMAGKEVSGIENAAKTLFQGAHFILTPKEKNLPKNVELLEKMAKHMGFRDIVTATPEKHDSIIAYTSQVMHVMAAAVCDDPELFDCKGFEGGSFRDCTRVAALDVPLWTELFSLNSAALCRIIDRLEASLRGYREAIMGGDRGVLAAKLTYSSERKKQMNFEGPPRGDEHKSEGETRK